VGNRVRVGSRNGIGRNVVVVGRSDGQE